MIGIVDYGLSNISSVVNALAAIEQDAFVARKPADLVKASKIILPGVGAFGDGMDNLRKGQWVDELESQVRKSGKLVLGLCLGMQFLATTGYEMGVHQGLGWVSGSVNRIPSEDPVVRVPHIGWNDVTFTKTDGLYAGMGQSRTFYFVHSFILCPDNSDIVSGVCSYGRDFTASVEIDNIFAVQFHPEKSQTAGLNVLKNFASMKD